MRFGVNSRKGASSLIVVMFVAVIALAGTAVYVALDETVMAENGYALPGSTFEYRDSTSDDRLTLTVVGFGDGLYYFENTNSGARAYDAVVNEISSIGSYLEYFEDRGIEYTRENVNVDVPDVGKTNGVRYVVEIEQEVMTITTVLHGIPYSVEAAGESLIMTESDASIGEYSNPNNWHRNYVSRGTTTPVYTLERIGKASDGNFIYRMDISMYDNFTFIGDSNGIPIGVTTSSCQISDTDGYETVTATISNGQLISIGSYQLVSS